MTAATAHLLARAEFETQREITIPQQPPLATASSRRFFHRPISPLGLHSGTACRCGGEGLDGRSDIHGTGPGGPREKSPQSFRRDGRPTGRFKRRFRGTINGPATTTVCSDARPSWPPSLRATDPAGDWCAAGQLLAGLVHAEGRAAGGAGASELSGRRNVTTDCPIGGSDLS